MVNFTSRLRTKREKQLNGALVQKITAKPNSVKTRRLKNFERQPKSLL